MTRRREIADLQILRAIAALGVVLDHSAMFTADRAGSNPGLNDLFLLAGYVGVWIFFVISGLIMVETSFDRFGEGNAPQQFVIKRAARILPIYYIGTLLAFFAARKSESLAGLIQSVLFVPYLNASGMPHPVLGQGWTLNYEVFFYAVFAVGLLFRRSIGLPLIGIVMLAVVTAGYLLPADRLPAGLPRTLLGFYSDPIILLFVAGMAVSLIRRNGPSLSGLPNLALSLTAYLMIFVVHLAVNWKDLASVNLEPPVLALLVILVVFFADSPERQRGPAGRLLMFLGDASFSIYIFHPFVLSALERAHLYEHAGYLGFMVLAPGLATAACVGAYLAIERPLQSALRRMTAAPARAPSPLPVR